MCESGTGSPIAVPHVSREKTCCFTGHRPGKLPWGEDEMDFRCLALKERLQETLYQIYDRGWRHFICGMAQGTDLYFCEAVLALRDERPGVTVEAAIPCETQARRWKEKERSRYSDLVRLCDTETFVQRPYTRGCMQRRNRYMVDHSSLLLAASCEDSGGAAYTIAYAKKRGLEIISLPISFV